MMAPRPHPPIEEKSSKEKITRAAGAVSLATLISRILGFVRDMIIANLFGAKVAADAFFIAFRIPNLLRRLTAEGAMTAAFVPIFVDSLEKDGKQKAFALTCNIVTILAVALTLLSALGVIFAPQVVRVVAPGFVSEPYTFALTTMLTRYLFPYIIFISVSAVLMAALNSMGKFFIPALAPALLNVAIITSALALHDEFEEPTVALAIGVLIGGVLQLITQIIPLMRLGWRYVPSFSLKDADTKKVGLLMIPAAFGMAVAEINVFVDTMLASVLPEGSISYLYYGNRVTQFPLGVFGVAIGIAALPSMAGEVSRGAKDKLVELVSHSFRLILFISLPATVGLIVLAGPITNVLFERGEFDSMARHGVITAIVYYAIGLVAFSGVKVIASAFYSLKDTGTPVRVAAWCMALNILLNILLMIPLKHGGLALATSISSMVNLTLLLWLLGRKLGGINGEEIINASIPMIAGATFMAVFVWRYASVFFDYGGSIFNRSIHLGVAIFIGAFIYAMVLLTFGSKEALVVKEKIFGRLTKKK